MRKKSSIHRVNFANVQRMIDDDDDVDGNDDDDNKSMMKVKMTMMKMQFNRWTFVQSDFMSSGPLKASFARPLAC